ncbi:MAG: hypothetical protein PWP23_361 [Candidatus Sumerlaeota bacterium]|nr:hypothetical protein [Candidatus Sumerlaeota bacterium]
MPLQRLKALFARQRSPQPEEGLDAEVRDGAARFAAWAAGVTKQPCPVAWEGLAAGEQALEALRREAPADGLGEQAASDAAAFFGEATREQLGGTWREDALLGVVLAGVGGVEAARLIPMALVEKKWELGGGLSLALFFTSIEERLVRERAFRARWQLPGQSAAQLITQTPPGRELVAARELTERFNAWWKARFGMPPALSLQGVRELERFLRSQFFLIMLEEDRLAEAGVFLGEVGRGLFQGEWDFAEARGPEGTARVALRWPELPYYPVGRVLRLVTERPEGEALDEYLRLIPSARTEIRKQQAGA